MTRFYAYRILPSGQRVRVTPAGRMTFGKAMLAYVQKRARRKGQTLVTGVASKQTSGKRMAMKLWMQWALSNEASIHYLQSRPMPLEAMKAHTLPFWTDCSGSTTGCFYAAGLPDPNGRDYDGSGFTGTLRARLPELAGVEACKTGDFIVYGHGTGSHVVMVYEPGRDPLCFSHGQESGPKLYRHSAENAAHGGYFTCHDAGAGA